MISADKFNGLSPFVCVAKETKIMIIGNYWIAKGLVNGSTGTLKHIIYARNTMPPDLPIVLMVKMDEPYKGPVLSQSHPYVYTFITRIIIIENILQNIFNSDMYYCHQNMLGFLLMEINFVKDINLQSS